MKYTFLIIVLLLCSCKPSEKAFILQGYYSQGAAFGSIVIEGDSIFIYPHTIGQVAPFKGVYTIKHHKMKVYATAPRQYPMKYHYKWDKNRKVWYLRQKSDSIYLYADSLIYN